MQIWEGCVEGCCSACGSGRGGGGVLVSMQMWKGGGGGLVSMRIWKGGRGAGQHAEEAVIETTTKTC